MLEAAAHVLVERGPGGFTTNHVADRAGVSVGSLYQYFPNKAALLLQLHVREARHTLICVQQALQQAGQTPTQRMHNAIRVFFATEAAEAPLRNALARTNTLFADAPEFKEIEDQARRFVHGFAVTQLQVAEAQAPEAAELVITVVSSMAERVTSQTTEPAALDYWADCVFNMLMAVLPLPVPDALLQPASRRKRSR